MWKRSGRIKKRKMTITSFPFQTFNWSSVPQTEHSGETGKAYWKTQMLNNIRVRLVEYSPGYKADHWCKKGHVLYCFDGEMETELEDGRIMPLRAECTTLSETIMRHTSRQQ